MNEKEHIRTMPEPERRSVTYTIHIAAAPERIWQALTDPDLMQDYFGGRRIESDFRPGGDFRMMFADGRLDVAGTVIEADPPRRLSLSWRIEWDERQRLQPPSLLTFTIAAAGEEVTALTVEHGDYQAPLPDAFFDAGRRGWPIVASALKTLLETGRRLAVEL